MNKASITLLLLLLITIMNTQNTLSNTSYITIRLLLNDNTPLPNAELIIKSGIFTVWAQNISNEDGYVYLKPGSDTINKLSIEIYYEPYGLIYSLKNLDQDNIPEEIVLPYIKLNKTFIITDEYLHKVNGSYTLYYNDIEIAYGVVLNGKLVINGTGINNKYILLGISSDTSIELTDYKLVITTSGGEQTEFYLTSTNTEKIILDIHPPLINISDIESRVIKKANLVTLLGVINYTDGVYSDKVSITVEVSHPRYVSTLKGSIVEVVTRKASIEECSIKDDRWYKCIFKYNELLSLIPSNYSIIPVKIIVNAIDHTGKRTVLEKLYYVNITTTNNSLNNGVNQGNNNSLLSNVQKHNGAKTVKAPSSGGIFKPPRSSIYEPIILLYSLGPIIGSIILIYELLHYRREQGNVNSSHA